MGFSTQREAGPQLANRKERARQGRQEGKATAGSEDDTVTGREVKDLARDRANLEAWRGPLGPRERLLQPQPALPC